MTATTIDRGDVKTYPFGPIRLGVKADEVIPAGVLVTKVVGDYAVNGVATALMIVMGVSLHAVDATGKDDGDYVIDVLPGKSGPYVLAGATAADIGAMTYLVDNQTLSLSNSNGTRPPAGEIWDVDAKGVYIDVDPLAGAQAQGEAATRIQTGRGTLAAGVLTVNAGITVTATSRIFASRVDEAGTDGDEIRVPDADRTVGGPGVGAVTFRAYLSGAAATSDTSEFDWMIVG